MNDLINNLDKLHTTELGAQRIRKNMQTDESYIVSLCRSYISMPDAKFQLVGKNWYVESNNFIFTVNARSYTMITVKRADKIKRMNSDAER